MKKYCPTCKRSLDKKHFFHNKARKDGLSSQCRKCHMVYTKRTWKKLKDKVIEYLGSKCEKCGITDKRVLQIDHIKGDGEKERRGKNRISSNKFCKKVLSTPKGKEYQLLCANCNWIKKYENEEYYHSKLVI